MSEERWLLRKSGKVTGPFSRAQLEGLRKRGQLSPFHEVSTDRQNWVSASELIGSFGDASGGSMGAIGQGARVDSGYAFDVQSQPSAVHADTASVAQSALIWFYNDAASTPGPVPTNEIVALMNSGRLTGESLVWKDGYPLWVAIKDVPELAAYLPGPLVEIDTSAKPRTLTFGGSSRSMLIAAAGFALCSFASASRSGASRASRCWIASPASPSPTTLIPAPEVTSRRQSGSWLPARK